MAVFLFLSRNLDTTFSKLNDGAAEVDAMAKPARNSKDPIMQREERGGLNLASCYTMSSTLTRHTIIDH